MLEDYYTTREVAELHGVTAVRVTQWITSGMLAAEKVNHTWLIPKDEAHKFKRIPKGRPTNEV